jgi:hypothetical protein
MDLIAYLHPGWAPLIRPAPATRPWMDETPEAFAYRCLPLNIANAHGWEVLNPCGFEAIWDGRPGVEAITIKPDAGAAVERLPVSLFGQGVITFHIEAIFRTPPGWDLYVGGSPNRPKDAISPLTGVVETDWSPFTFTMNWKFTRPGLAVRFEAMEPICFLFPLERTAVEAFNPSFALLREDSATEARFKEWSEARDAFHAQMLQHPPKAPSDRWQKHYYRGVDVSGDALVSDHRSKLRLRAFDRTGAPDAPLAPASDIASPRRSDEPIADKEVSNLRVALAKREWLLESLERQRQLAPPAAGIERRHNISSEEFLERYYAMNRPVILTGEMVDWPALKLWTPAYLRAKVGSNVVEYQGDRSADPRFETDKDSHRREAPFDAFIDRITQGVADNDAYITAYNSARNQEALSTLHGDLGFIDKVLDPTVVGPHGMMWIGPAGTFTALHHDLTNNLIAQVVGRKRLLVLPASEVGHLYNDTHVFSRISDLQDPTIDPSAFPRLAGARAYEVMLEPGEAIFMPFAWWHQVRSLDFSVTLTYTNFRWPNEAYATYPEG